MKLFGNKRDSSRVEKSKGLSGAAKGWLLILGSFLVLGLTVFAVYKDFVRPVDIKPADKSDAENGLVSEDTFVPPTFTQVETTVDDNGNAIQVEVEVPASYKEGFYNILLAGTDEDGTRTDTIMIGRIDVENHTLALMSIPRDTLIDADYKVPKINSVYGRAGQGRKGMEALKNQLASLLGFEVNGYILVDLDAFVELVDLVGGVDFEVPQDMDYDDPSQDLHIHFKKGMQHLDGQSAMEVVRFRSGYAAADIRRTEVQQAFMKALAKKCLAEINLAKLVEMANVLDDNVITDLSLGNLVYYGRELLDCDYENMFTCTLQGESVMVNGADCYALYLKKTLEVVNGYFNPYEMDLTEDNVRIRTPESIHGETEQPETQEKPEKDPVSENKPSDSEKPSDNEKPNQPVAPPSEQIKPENPPQQPDNPPEQPDDPPEQPDNPPQQPDDPPEQPENPPQQPENPPEQPDDPPEQPDNPPEQPDDPPEQPDNPPQQPDDPPEQPDNPPQQPDNPGSGGSDDDGGKKPGLEDNELPVG